MPLHAREVLPQVILPADAVGAWEVVDQLAGGELGEGFLVEGVAPVDVVRGALDQAAEADALEAVGDAVDVPGRGSGLGA